MASTLKKHKRKAVVAPAQCVACGCCQRICPVKAIEVFYGVYAQADPMRCVGCGKCAKACPASVIRMEEEEL